jgi:hypothetical protein
VDAAREFDFAQLPHDVEKEPVGHQMLLRDPVDDRIRAIGAPPITVTRDRDFDRLHRSFEKRFGLRGIEQRTKVIGVKHHDPSGKTAVRVRRWSRNIGLSLMNE